MNPSRRRRRADVLTRRRPPWGHLVEHGYDSAEEEEDKEEEEEEDNHQDNPRGHRREIWKARCSSNCRSNIHALTFVGNLSRKDKKRRASRNLANIER